MNYKISQRALQDLNDIWQYTHANWSIIQADRYYNLILDQIEFLSKEVYNGISRDYIKIGYRSIAIKSHIVFYKISDDNVLEVVRILHKMVDIETKLKE
ncbi:type II toxin-antitoxin system RelE/ParE family toxin [Bacteroidota bacterium]